jgi:heptosyltransferase-2
VTTPAIKALRRAYPGARLSVLVAAATQDLVRGNPYVDEVLVDDRKTKHKGLWGFWRLVREIRLKKFDLAIIFHTKRRYNFACWAAGIPSRLGYKNDKFGFLLNMPLIDTRNLGQKHEAEYCLNVLKAIGVEGGDLDMFVPVQKEAESWVLAWMQENNLKSNEFVVIHPGASDPAKCWSTEYFAVLIDRLIEHYNLKIVLMGTGPAMALADGIMRKITQHGTIFDLTGKTTLAQTAALLRRARLLISNDSGPVHIAAGVGISVISLFMRDRPGINAERWKPLGPKSFFLKPNQGGTISVDDVLKLAKEVFHKHGQYEIF